MIVYRIIKYEGEPADIAEMFRLSINGEYHPSKLKITAAPVEPRIVEQTPMIVHALQQVAGKRWEPPVERRPASPLTAIGRNSVDDIRKAADFIQHIDELLENGYGWARETLEGISETVERTNRVTEGQYTAVENIENARRDR